jgi:predicted RNase H-like nuclease (RuvC/YqgF family)
MLGRRASSPRYIQEHRELRTIRSEARRLQQELHLASAREAALAQQLGRSRAEAAELGARLASVQDSSRASKRSAREALAELAEENAKLVAAYVEKRRELRRLQARPAPANNCVGGLDTAGCRGVLRRLGRETRLYFRGPDCSRPGSLSLHIPHCFPHRER